jgi:hypothetical protein
MKRFILLLIILFIIIKLTFHLKIEKSLLETNDRKILKSMMDKLKTELSKNN